jgi:hypothetical protein
MSPFIWVVEIAKFIETESRNVGMRVWGKEKMGSYCFNGYRDSVWDDESVPEMNNSNGNKTMQIYLML